MYQYWMAFVFIVILGFVIMWQISEHRTRQAAKRLQDEAQAKLKAEADRIHALPKLDTSRMLAVPMTLSDIAENANLGGTFGNRYIHMLVSDRNGRAYLCFMTEYNMRALWRSEFKQATYSPYLIEQDEDFFIGEVKIGVYPASLRNYPRYSDMWVRWAELHKEFYAHKGNNHDHFKKYFEGGKPRKAPLANVA